MREYVTASIQYDSKVKHWLEMGRIGKPPEQPGCPWLLALYFELRAWGTHELVSGGVMEQPAWTWKLMNFAGRIYEEVMRRNKPLAPEA